MEDYTAWREMETYGEMDEKMLLNALCFCGQVESLNWKVWTANARAAHQYNRPFVSDLYGSKSGSCLVCGAGPSLSNGGILAEFQKRGIDIIATDRALKTVRDAGVKEFMSVSTECQPECGDFLEVAGVGDKCCLSVISNTDTLESLLERGADVYNCAFMTPRSNFKEWVTKLYERDVSCVRTDYLVTFIAIDIAFWMGYNPIFCIGNDLSYDDPFSCYEDSCFRAIRELPNGMWTFPMFEEAGRNFVQFCMWHPDHHFYDFSGGLMNWPQLNPKEFLEKGV